MHLDPVVVGERGTAGQSPLRVLYGRYRPGATVEKGDGLARPALEKGGT